MNPIKESTWELVEKYTWEELSDHQWSDFYLMLIEIDEPAISIKPIEVKNIVVNVRATDEIEINPILIETSRINIYAENLSIDVTGVDIRYNKLILQTWSEMAIDIITSDRNYLSAMLDYLPWYERKSKVFIEILNAYASEFIKAEQEISVIKLNQFLDTAVEVLTLYEQELGIKQVNKLDYRQRREQIISYLRGIAGQTTEEEIKNISKAYTKGDIEINKTNEPGVFEIKFIDELGVPSNIEGLKRAINKVIPAHLKFEYHYQYNPLIELQ